MRLTRDSAILHLTFIAAVLTFIVTATTTLVPETHVPLVKDVAAVAGFVAGWLKTSPLPGR